jgi:hypothetical protein
MFFLLSLYFFSSTKSENKSAEQVLPESRGGGQIMYTHVSKCKNDKIQFKNNFKM